MTEILETINQPADLKHLSAVQLHKLTAEIRRKLITVVNANGGHLASNLGVVELTLALHRVFDSPRDKIIWDVGHQSYVHKLLTGRRASFETLRQYGGVSGYTSRDESVHDVFGAGHASTSVSAALGMARARDIHGEDYHVVAVIGDGAITGGMAIEAINHAGHLGTRIIVILNDNGMSISPTVGALARFLERVRFDRYYRRAKITGHSVISRLPMGNRVWRWLMFAQDRFKRLVLPNIFWESLGMTYLGPVDGHNLHDLERTLRTARDNARKPMLVHVVTTKGKGYRPAESDAVYFHGLAPPKADTPSVPTYSEVFARTLLKLARQDPRIVAITPAMPEGSALNIFEKEFPDRLYDVGICEQHSVTFAAGLALQGLVPVVAIYSTFLQRAFDQIIHDVCLQNIPVVFAIDRAGIVGDDGKTHQGAFDLSYLSLVPNLVVAAPADENELQHLLYTAVKLGRPMAVRYPRSAGLGASLDKELHEIPLGSAALLRQGEDALILAIGNRVAPSLEAATVLEAQGIRAAVVNARYAKPLDTDLILDLAGRLKCVITVEENVLRGGFGSQVASLLQSASLRDVGLHSLGIADEFVEAGPQDRLRAKYGLDAAGIAAAISEFVAQHCKDPLTPQL